MVAQIKPTGLLKSYTGEKGVIPLEASEFSNKSVRDVLISLNIPSEMVAMVLINGRLQEKDYLIQDGDVIQLVPLIGGG
jgi:molybdopterin converting factor small subunit